MTNGHDDEVDRPDGDPISPSQPLQGEPLPQERSSAVASPEEEPAPVDDIVAKMMSGQVSLDLPELASAVQRQDAADAADTLEALEGEEAAEVLVEMDEKAAADALAEMEKPLAVSVIEDLVDEDNAVYAGRLIQLMAPDDAADLLQLMDEKHREGLLTGMPYVQAFKLRKLISYDRESAGGLMTTDYLALRDGMAVAQAIDVIRTRTIPEDMQHLPVISSNGKLVGVIGLRDLLINQPAQKIAALMHRELKTVRAQTDREEVAREFERYNLAMMPVVDEKERLIGIVTVDDVIDIITAETTEDVQKTVGAGGGEAVYSGIPVKFRGRFPWLVVNLCTSLVAAVVVLQFDELISELAILAVLMPVIANQAGNAGQQSLAVTLRGIVLDEVRAERVWPLLLREAAVGAINGTLGGTLIGLGLSLLGLVFHGMHGSWKLGIVAGVSMALALSIGCFAGSTIPILMRRMKFDPAHGSTIFLTMITDSLSFFTFLGCAKMASHWLMN